MRENREAWFASGREVCMRGVSLASELPMGVPQNRIDLACPLF
jgi:hypothetical protein